MVSNTFARATAFAVCAILMIASFAPAAARSDQVKPLKHMTASIAKAMRDVQQQHVADASVDRRVLIAKAMRDIQPQHLAGKSVDRRILSGHALPPANHSASSNISSTGNSSKPTEKPPSGDFSLAPGTVCANIETSHRCSSHDGEKACIADKECSFKTEDGEKECVAKDDLGKLFEGAGSRLEGASADCDGRDAKACVTVDGKCHLVGEKCVITMSAVLNAYPEDNLFAEMFSKVIMCSQKSTEKECTGDCQWASTSCEFNGGSFYQQAMKDCGVVPDFKLDPDALCDAFGDAIQCGQYEDKAACDKNNEHCEYNEDEKECAARDGPGKLVSEASVTVYSVIATCSQIQEKEKCTGDCQWASASNRCAASPEAIEKMFPEDKQFAEMMALSLTCGNYDDKSCGKTEESSGCKWWQGEGQGNCGMDDEYYIKIAQSCGLTGAPPPEGKPEDGRPQKPFKVPADFTCKSLEASLVCESIDDKETCNKEKFCAYNDEDEECNAHDDLDMGKATEAITGARIMEPMYACMYAQDKDSCEKNKDCSYSDSTYFKCTMKKSAMKALVPEDATLGDMISEGLGCSMLSGDDDKCVKEGCVVNGDEGSCGADENMYSEMLFAKVPECAKKMKLPSSCSVYKMAGKCAAISTKEACDKDCHWEESVSKCRAPEEMWSMAILPYYGVVAKASQTCDKLRGDAEKCNAQAGCTYVAREPADDSGCETTETSMLDTVSKAAKDPVFTAHAKLAKKEKCDVGEKDTAEKCTANKACAFDAEDKKCELDHAVIAAAAACACPGQGKCVGGEKPSAAELEEKKKALEERKAALEQQKKEMAERKKKAEEAKAAAMAKKAEREKVAAEKKAKADAAKKAAKEKREKAAEAKAAAMAKRDAILANITDPKMKKKAALAAAAAIAGGKIKKFKAGNLTASNATDACETMCSKMKVDCDAVVCEATPAANATRRLLASGYSVDIQVNTAEVDTAAVEQSLEAEGVEATTEDVDPYVELAAAGVETSEVDEMKTAADATVAAEQEKEEAEQAEAAAVQEESAAVAAVAEAEEEVADAEQEITAADEEVKEAETAIAEADTEITATAGFVASVTPPPPPPSPSPPPVITTVDSGAAAGVARAAVAVAVAVLLAALA